MYNIYDVSSWALILGGSSGIGLATAHKLASHGMSLCIIHRDRRSAMPEIIKEFNRLKSHPVELMFFNMDALSVESRRQIIDELVLKLEGQRRIKLLLHCIAKGNLKPLVSDQQTTLSGKDYHLTIEAMATSLWDWTRDLLDADLLGDPASIIGLTSEGNQKVWPGYGAVSAAKATLESLIRQMAVELAPLGIRANAIQAGITDTPSLRMIPGADQLIETAIKRNPYQRLTQPEDIANVVSLLCQPEAAWINGAVIPVDGGESLR
jgi:enoyl-[acyl-carrier protein] reductase III